MANLTKEVLMKRIFKALLTTGLLLSIPILLYLSYIYYTNVDFAAKLGIPILAEIGKQYPYIWESIPVVYLMVMIILAMLFGRQIDSQEKS